MSWPWEMVLANSLGTVLAPTAVLMPTTTIEARPVLWAFLMHPGSTHTCNLIGWCRDVFAVIEDAVSSERALFRSAWNWQHDGRASDSKNPFAGEVDMNAGSGTLEGDGKLMTLRQNLGRCCGFTSEGTRLLMWPQNEEHMNEPLVVELYERAGGSAQQWTALAVAQYSTLSLLLLVRCTHSTSQSGIGRMICRESSIGSNFFHTHPTFKRAREVVLVRKCHAGRRSFLRSACAKCDDLLAK